MKTDKHILVAANDKIYTEIWGDINLHVDGKISFLLIHSHSQISHQIKYHIQNER